MVWECGIAGCGSVYDTVEDAIVHQANEHERRECKICGSVVPDGYLSIYHVFTEHSRVEYVRAYGADSSDVRCREALLDEIADVVDQEALAERLDK